MSGRPRAFESILRMVGPVTTGGQTRTLASERVRIAPFDLSGHGATRVCAPPMRKPSTSDPKVR